MEQESLDVQVGSPSPFFPCVPLHLQNRFSKASSELPVSAGCKETLDAAPMVMQRVATQATIPVVWASVGRHLAVQW